MTRPIVNHPSGPPHQGDRAAIDAAAQSLATDPVLAERQARAVLSRLPNDPRGVLILASARRRQGDCQAALALLEPLAKAYPKAAHTQYELGLSLAGLGRTDRAVSALRQAVALKRDMADAWRALGDQLFLAGDAEGAEAGYAEYRRAAITDPRLKEAADALFHSAFGQAEHLLRQRLTADPNDTAALRMLAEAYLRQSRSADAEILLAHCLALDPGLDDARFSYANALFQQQKAVPALAQIERLLAERPDEPAYRNLAAACLGLVGEHDRVNSLYEGLLADYGKQPRIWLNYGHALRTVGRQAEAVAAYKRCIALAPGLGEAYWSLANLKVASFTPDEEASMARHLARPDIPADDRLHLHFALGKALEDRGDYAASFEHYAQGAKLRRAQIRYDADQTTRHVERSKAVFTADFFAARTGGGFSSDEPIFIVGLPRSGSTLVEQILASHSAVEGTMELPDIGFIAQELGWSESGEADSPYPASPYPACLAALDDARRADLGRAYLDATRIHRKLGRPFFIDKMPNNFHHLGLIQLILPGSKIIDVRRHPIASGFSAFKQHFARGQNFSYDLTDIGRYYRDYVALLSHFDDVLPNRIHRVSYERLVEDTETEVRQLLEYCNLPFEEGCLKFYQNDRAVRTVSSEQVRRPISREGLNQWRHYEPWLGPLSDALGSIADSV